MKNKNLTIESDVKYGKNFAHEHNVVIYKNVTIGNNVTLGNNVVIYPDTVIGDNVTILDNCIIGKPLRFGANSARKISQPGPLLLKDGVIVGSGSIIYRGSVLEKNVYIGDMVNIRERCHINHDATIGKMVSLEHEVTIGHHSRVMDCSQITEYSEIKNYVFIGPDVSLCSDPSFARIENADKKIVIEDKAMIGANASLMPGITIGQNALVAGGSVVIKNVPPRKVVMGNPAKILWDVDTSLIL